MPRQPHAYGVNRRYPYNSRPQQDGPQPREYPRSFQRRPQPSRKKPKGPAAFEPREPLSRRDWKRMVGAATARLSRLTCVHGGRLERMSDGDLLGIVSHVPAGQKNRRGKARRLAVKLIRLRGNKPEPALLM